MDGSVHSPEAAKRLLPDKAMYMQYIKRFLSIELVLQVHEFRKLCAMCLLFLESA